MHDTHLGSDKSYIGITRGVARCQEEKNKRGEGGAGVGGYREKMLRELLRTASADLHHLHHLHHKHSSREQSTRYDEEALI